MKYLTILVIGLFTFFSLSSFAATNMSEKNTQKERTLSIIKPDAVRNNHIGVILDRFEKGGLEIIGAKMTRLSLEEAQNFYAIHKSRPFYNDLVSFMTSGPVFISVLEGENAVKKNRELMGATNPKEALPCTIRADFATSIEANAVHGSDSLENAKTEISFFFKENELF